MERERSLRRGWAWGECEFGDEMAGFVSGRFLAAGGYWIGFGFMFFNIQF